MLRFIFASHYEMADGLKSTIQFLTAKEDNIYAISAYTTLDYDLEKEVKALFDTFDEEDTVVIMTDIMAGSVNQKFYPYLSDKVHLITGINAPLAVELVLKSEEWFTAQNIMQTIEELKQSIVYVNTYQFDEDEDDE